MDKDDMVREILLARAVHRRLFDVVSGGAGVIDPWDPQGNFSSPRPLFLHESGDTLEQMFELRPTRG